MQAAAAWQGLSSAGAACGRSSWPTEEADRIRGAMPGVGTCTAARRYTWSPLILVWQAPDARGSEREGNRGDDNYSRPSRQQRHASICAVEPATMISRPGSSVPDRRSLAALFGMPSLNAT